MTVVETQNFASLQPCVGICWKNRPPLRIDFICGGKGTKNVDTTKR